MKMCGNPAALTIKRINPAAFGPISCEQIHQPFEDNTQSSELLFPLQNWCYWGMANLRACTTWPGVVGGARIVSLEWLRVEIMAQIQSGYNYILENNSITVSSIFILL